MKSYDEKFKKDNNEKEKEVIPKIGNDYFLLHSCRSDGPHPDVNCPACREEYIKDSNEKKEYMTGPTHYYDSEKLIQKQWNLVDGIEDPYECCEICYNNYVSRVIQYRNNKKKDSLV